MMPTEPGKVREAQKTKSLPRAESYTKQDHEVLDELTKKSIELASRLNKWNKNPLM